MVPIAMPDFGSSTSPMRPPNCMPPTSRSMTNQTSAMSTLPPVNESIRIDKNGMFCVSSVWRPASSRPTNLPSL